MLLTWLIMSRLGSNHDPKFFTFVEGNIRDSPITRCEVIAFSSCCLVLISVSMPFTEWESLQLEKRGQFLRDLCVAKTETCDGKGKKISKIPQPLRMLTLRRTVLKPFNKNVALWSKQWKNQEHLDLILKLLINIFLLTKKDLPVLEPFRNT